MLWFISKRQKPNYHICSMQMQLSRGLRTGSVMTLLLLAFATTVPALWTMHCVSSERVTCMWGEAKECNPSPCKTETPSVKVLCCEFSSAQSHLSEQNKKTQELFVLLPIHVEQFRPLVLQFSRCARSVASATNGPPWAKSKYDLVAIAQLRV